MDKSYINFKNNEYYNYINILKEKYGSVTGPYFKESSYKNKGIFVKNKDIMRGNEGLFVHHIAEDKYIMLSNINYCSHLPFELQLSENLVYCNYLEHLRLHLLIAEYSTSNVKIQKRTVINGNTEHIEVFDPSEEVGGGALLIIPILNDYFNGYKFKREWQEKALSLIDMSDYIDLLVKYILKGILPIEYSVITNMTETNNTIKTKILNKVRAEIKQTNKSSDYNTDKEENTKKYFLIRHYSNLYISEMVSSYKKYGYFKLIKLYQKFSNINKCGDIVKKEILLARELDEIDIHKITPAEKNILLTWIILGVYFAFMLVTLCLLC